MTAQATATQPLVTPRQTGVSDATARAIAASPLWNRAMPPGPDVRVKITEEYARHVARDAFFWAWPWSTSTTSGWARRSRTSLRTPAPCRLRRSTGLSCSPTTSPPTSASSPVRTRTWCTAAARWPWRIACRHPGAGLRRSLLGLSGGRPAHRRLRAHRQDVWHDARLLSARRAGLAWGGADRHQRRLSVANQHRLHRAPHLHGRHGRRIGAIQPLLRQIKMYPLPSTTAR